MPDNESSIDSLYKVYRRGLITRHICLNGRVDENTWLGQVKRPRRHAIRLGEEIPKHGWIFPNTRKGSEEYETIDTGQIESKVFEWVPLYNYGRNIAWDFRLEEEWDNFLNKGIGKSWGGGDNPLLSTGLALATFSIEYLDNVTETSSLKYADLLFTYIEECEYKKSGFFVRQPTWNKERKWASTDEMLGVAIGLYYYWLAKKRSNESTNSLRELVGRWAECMGRHGYWLLPDSDIFDDVADRNEPPDLGKQQAWIFAYSFRQLFYSIADKNPSIHWNDDEWSFYFGWPRHFDTAQILLALGIYGVFLPVMIITQLVDWAEDLWEWLFGSDEEDDMSVEEIWNLMESTGIYGTPWRFLADCVEAKIEDVYGHVHSGQFFRALWENIEDLANENHPLISGITKIVGRAATRAVDSLLPGTEAIGVGDAFGDWLSDWLRKEIYSQIDENTATFNFQLLAFYGHLGIELHDNNHNRKHVAKGLHALLSKNTTHCLGNGYLYTVFTRVYNSYRTAGGASWQLAPELGEAEKHLTHAKLWQHDLPLGQIRDMNALFSNPQHRFYTKDNNEGSDITDEVHDTFETHGGAGWHDIWRNWAFPRTYNPREKIGEVRTWEHKPGKHVYTGTTGWLYRRAVKTEGPGSTIYARALFEKSNGRDIRLEGCGLGLLFPIALRRFWNQSHKLMIEDTLLPILPYEGAGGQESNWYLSFSDTLFGNKYEQYRENKYVVLSSIFPLSGFPNFDNELQIVPYNVYQQYLYPWIAEQEWDYWWNRKRNWNLPDQARTRLRCDVNGEDNRELISKASTFGKRPYMRPISNWRKYENTRWAICAAHTNNKWFPKVWQDLYRFRGWENLRNFPQTRELTCFIEASGEWEYAVEASNNYQKLEEQENVWISEIQGEINTGHPIILATGPGKIIQGQLTFHMLATHLREYCNPAQPLVHVRLKVRPVINRLGGDEYTPVPVIGSQINTTCDLIGKEVFDIQDLRYVVNMNSLVIHDLKNGHHRHIKKAARGYRLIPLPIPTSVEISNLEIPKITDMIEKETYSPKDYWSDLNQAVRRKDYVQMWSGWKRKGNKDSPYELGPPRRLRSYLEVHPGKKRDYLVKNEQRLRLCSYCFSSHPDFPAPY